MPRLVETKKEQDLQLVQHPESMWVSGGSVAQTARSVPRLLERRKKEARPAANTAALTASRYCEEVLPSAQRNVCIKA
eukprot:scaffold79225_cov20-Tisochrysis_lutea.AAC.1